MGFPIRKSLDQSPFAAPQGLSQRTTSFIASQHQGIHQIPLRHLIVLIIDAHPSAEAAGVGRPDDLLPSEHTRQAPITHARTEEALDLLMCRAQQRRHIDQLASTLSSGRLTPPGPKGPSKTSAVKHDDILIGGQTRPSAGPAPHGTGSNVQTTHHPELANRTTGRSHPFHPQPDRVSLHDVKISRNALLSRAASGHRRSEDPAAPNSLFETPRPCRGSTLCANQPTPFGGA